jgi:hypothetical protein
MRFLPVLFISFHLAASGMVMIKIPPGVPLEESAVRAALPGNIAVGKGFDRIEIVVYYFSLGIERLSYGDNDEIRESAQEGKMKALIKLKKNGVLTRALFISSGGAGKDEILKAFSREFAVTIAGQ